MEIEEMKILLKKKESERNQNQEKIKYLSECLSMPFYQRIQQKGFEEQYEGIKERQKEVFKKYTLKKYLIKKPRQEAVFMEFWNEYLKGNVENLNEFMISKKYPLRDTNI